MRPAPKKIAVLISLMLFGAPWSSVVFAEDDEPLKSKAASMPEKVSRDTAARNALALPADSNPRPAVLEASSRRHASSETAPSPAAKKETAPALVAWAKEVLGLDDVKITPVPMPAKTLAPEHSNGISKPQREQFMLALKLALGLGNEHGPAGDSAVLREAASGEARNQLPALPQTIILMAKSDQAAITPRTTPSTPTPPNEPARLSVQPAIALRLTKEAEQPQRSVESTLDTGNAKYVPVAQPVRSQVETTVAPPSTADSRKSVASKSATNPQPDTQAHQNVVAKSPSPDPTVSNQTERAGNPIVVLIRLPDMPEPNAAKSPSINAPPKSENAVVDNGYFIGESDYTDNQRLSPKAALAKTPSEKIVEPIKEQVAVIPPMITSASPSRGDVKREMDLAGEVSVIAPRPAPPSEGKEDYDRAKHTAYPLPDSLRVDEIELTGRYEIQPAGNDKAYTVDTIRVHDATGRNPMRGDWLVLSDARLDDMRGGFETGEGLKISFGIERAVYINGNLVTTTSLNVSDLSKLTGGQAQAVALNGSSLAVIQSGPGNALQLGAISPSAVGAVVQNTLNGQTIQHVTTINATVNSMQVLKALNLQSTIRDALSNSIRK